MNTPLAKFSGPIERTAFWKRLTDETKLKLPALQTPAIFITIDFLFCMVEFCCIALIVSFAVYTVPAPHISFCLALLLISFLCMHFSNSLLWKLLKFCSEKYSWAALVFSTPTIRELTKSVASMNRSQLVTPTSKHYEEIWPRLVKIVSGTLAIAPDEIVPEARFIEDLSCG